MIKHTFLLIAAAAAMLLATVASAKPPEHAPAHGWRKKNDPAYVGYTGTAWERDFDIGSGRCNREEIGAVLGGVVGGVIGSRSSEEHRTVATIIGVAAGALIGARIGRELDEGDKGCVGHALEMGKAGQRITWSNPRTGVAYVLIPDAGKVSKGKSCRGFVMVATLNGKKEERRGNACQSSAGRWEIS
jgi:surface antigen